MAVLYPAVGVIGSGIAIAGSTLKTYGNISNAVSDGNGITVPAEQLWK